MWVVTHIAVEHTHDRLQNTRPWFHKNSIINSQKSTSIDFSNMRLGKQGYFVAQLRVHSISCNWYLLSSEIRTKAPQKPAENTSIWRPTAKFRIILIEEWACQKNVNYTSNLRLSCKVPSITYVSNCVEMEAIECSSKILALAGIGSLKSAIVSL
jgi:hypothetical protein